MWDIKDFESLHRFKIKHGDELPIHSKYFFCNDNKMIFIKKSRRFYKVVASAQCDFEPCYRESIFDVLYVSDDFSKTLLMFYGYIARIIGEV